MTTFTIHFRSTGENVAEGTRDDPPVTVRVNRCGDDLLVSMLSYGQRIGEGVARRVGDEYQGTCTEYAGLWHVRGEINTGCLRFSEEKPCP